MAGRVRAIHASPAAPRRGAQMKYVPLKNGSLVIKGKPQGAHVNETYETEMEAAERWRAPARHRQSSLLAACRDSARARVRRRDELAVLDGTDVASDRLNFPKKKGGASGAAAAPRRAPPPAASPIKCVSDPHAALCGVPSHSVDAASTPPLAAFWFLPRAFT